jgi:hypothetical protein
MPYYPKGLGQVSTVPTTITGPPSSEVGLLIGGAAALAGLIFLPGPWKLAVLAAPVALLVGSNWQRCQGGPLPAGTFCANGLELGGQPPSGQPGTSCPPATSSQMFNCLTQFFGGYQGGF